MRWRCGWSGAFWPSLFTARSGCASGVDESVTNIVGHRPACRHGDVGVS